MPAPKDRANTAEAGDRNAGRSHRARFKQIAFTHLRQVKGSLCVAIVCMVGVIGMTLLRPWPLKFIFDYILFDKPLTSALSFLEGDKVVALVVLCLSIVVIAILQGFFYYYQITINARMGQQMIHALRRDLFAHLQRLSLSFHNRVKSGELLTKVTSDTNSLKNLVVDSALPLTAHVLTLVGMFTIMFMLNWQLAMIILATFPVLFYTLNSLMGKVKTFAKRQRRKEGALASRVSESLALTLLVQAFGRERYEEERFARDSSKSLKEGVRTARATAAATRTAEIIGAIGTGAVLLFGSLQVLKGHMTPGDILIFAAYVKSGYKPLRHLTKLSAKFSKAMVSAERVGEILDTEPAIQDSPDAIEVSNLKGEIVFDHVSFDYGDGNAVLTDVSLTIAPGQRVALLGPSGAGKSTIVSLLLRLYDPTSGAIRLDGRDMRSYQRASLRREIGLVLQDALLFGASIGENIAYGKPEASPQEIENAARQAKAADFIAALPDGYDTILGERGTTLSGGQRQRICLARSLIKHPSILILDEPTSAVDSTSARLIHEAIRTLQAGKTTITIAHQFISMHHFDLILVLDHGTIIAKGTHDELLKRSGAYRRLVGEEVGPAQVSR